LYYFVCFPFRKDNLKEWRTNYIDQIQTALTKAVSILYKEELANLESVRLSTFVSYDQSVDLLADCVEQRTTTTVLPLAAKNATAADLNRTLAIVRDTFQPVIDALQLTLSNANSSAQLLQPGTEGWATTEEATAGFGRVKSIDAVTRATDFSASDDASAATTTLAPILAARVADQLTHSGCLSALSEAPLYSAQQLIHSWLMAEKEKLLRDLNFTISSNNSGSSNSSTTAAGMEFIRRVESLFTQLENVTTVSLAEAFRSVQILVLYEQFCS
jgi:hypothetical protein